MDLSSTGMSFRHTPLNHPAEEIRLLRITQDNPLRCSISVHTLASAPTYRAISYTWGPPIPTCNITVDGESFAVRANCSLALEQAHQHFGPETQFWLDAVCIDQDDYKEKSAQVGIMGEIFFQAERVLASIGSASRDSDVLFDLVWKLLAVQDDPGRENCAQCMKSDGTSGYVRHLSWRDFVALKQAYVDFASRPYWRRLWIMQEVALAHRVDVVCGRCIEKLDRLASFSESFFHVRTKEASGEDKHSVVRQLSLAYGRGQDHFKFVCARTLSRGQGEPVIHDRRKAYSFYAFLEALKDLQCTDVRDRIYGLLALVDWGSAGPLRPDYTAHPLHLAWDVVARHGRPTTRTHNFEFPKHFVRVLEAMESRISFVDVKEKRLRTDDWPLDWTARASQEEMHSVASCRCKEPVLPDTGLLTEASVWFTVREAPAVRNVREAQKIVSEDMSSFGSNVCLYNTEAKTLYFVRSSGIERHSIVSGSRGLQQTDILVRVIEYTNYFRFWLVLRKKQTPLYEILDTGIETKRTDSGSPFASEKQASRQDDLWLCLDIQDATVMVLSAQESVARSWFEQPVMPGEGTLTGYKLCHQRASSFALVKPTTWDADGIFIVPPVEVAGVPSVDGRSIPCAKCGGLFEPT